MGLLFAEMFSKENIADFEANKSIYYACGLTEIIHNGTLMIDDVQDQSKLRRGSDCTYIKYGVDIATNTSSFMYFAPL